MIRKLIHRKGTCLILPQTPHLISNFLSTSPEVFPHTTVSSRIHSIPQSSSLPKSEFLSSQHRHLARNSFTHSFIYSQGTYSICTEHQRELTSETINSSPTSYTKLTPCTYENSVPPSFSSRSTLARGQACGPLSQEFSPGPHLCLGSTMQSFSLEDYLSGKIVMSSPSKCLGFKVLLKAFLIWGAGDSSEVSWYVLLFISYRLLLIITEFCLTIVIFTLP